MTCTANLALRIQQCSRRARAFHAATEPGHVLVTTHFPVSAPSVPPLTTFDLDRQLDAYIDARLAAARPAWEARTSIDDDSLPSICPSFGIAEHSAWLGLDVLLQEYTCLPMPLVSGPEDLQKLTLSPQNRWFQLMQRGYEHLRRRQDGSFLLSVRGTMMPLDLANAVHGDELFVDVLDRPEFVHQLLSFLTDALPWYYDQLVSWADEIAGGFVAHMGGLWLPKPFLGHVSNDAALLCGPDIYAEFGFPYEARLGARYQRILYHVHNERMHYVPRLAELPGLALMEVSHDPKTPAPVEDLDRILSVTGHVPLFLQATSEQLRSHLGDVQDRNVVWNVACRDRDDAQDVVRLARDRSRPL